MKKTACFHPAKPPRLFIPSFPTAPLPFNTLLLSPVSLLARSTTVLDFKILEASLGNVLLFYQHRGLLVALI